MVRYSDDIAANWRYVALQLGITENRIMVIDIDHQYTIDKCFEMFKTWLQISVNSCWCQFIQALYDVKLFSVAEKAKAHLKLTGSSGIGMHEGNIRVICLIVVCK